jgi:hypothetical protein
VGQIDLGDESAHQFNGNERGGRLTACRHPVGAERRWSAWIRPRRMGSRRW